MVASCLQFNHQRQNVETLPVLTSDYTIACVSFRHHCCQGRVKLLSTAGSAAVLFNGIMESLCLARKILFLVLTVIREILVNRHSPLGNSKKTFLLLAALSNLTRPRSLPHDTIGDAVRYVAKLIHSPLLGAEP